MFHDSLVIVLFARIQYVLVSHINAIVCLYFIMNRIYVTWKRYWAMFLVKQNKWSLDMEVIKDSKQ